MAMMLDLIRNVPLGKPTQTQHALIKKERPDPKGTQEQSDPIQIL